MQLQSTTDRREAAAVEFDAQQSGGRGSHVTNSLSYGFSLLRSELFKRIHEDVERHCGVDSMLAPVSIDSLRKMEANTKVEIEIFQIAVSAEEVGEQGYVSDATWYRDWLARLRLGDVADRPAVTSRLKSYWQEAPGKRRLEFGDVLARAAPGATKTPLVLHRLFPYSVRIATNLAFDDRLSAAEVCDQRIAILPTIADCRECHGRSMDNGESCDTCGNPIWNFDWLRSFE